MCVDACRDSGTPAFKTWTSEAWLARILFIYFFLETKKKTDIVSKNKIIEMTKSPKAAAHSSEFTPFRCLTSDIHT